MAPIRDNPYEFIVDIEGSTCKRWTRSTNSHKRGHFSTKERKLLLVARFLLQEKLGRKLLQSEFACHTCDNGWCVNIDHLWVGTHQHNMDDKVRKNRQWRPEGEKHHLVKLTQQQVDQIRADPRMYIEIAPDYKVSKSLIGAIKRNEAWKR